MTTNKKFKLFLILATTLFAFIFANASFAIAQNASYSSYYNARFQYSIEYPSKVLLPRGESENGDGQTFTSNDDQSKLLVWGTYYGENFADNYQSSLSEYGLKYKITYSTLKKTFFVISGYNSQKIFYYKLIKLNGRDVGIYIEYPIDQKNSWGMLVQTIANSVKSTE